MIKKQRPKLEPLIWRQVQDPIKLSFAIEFLVQQEYEKVYIHFSFVKHFHYWNTFILHLKQVLQ